MFLIESLRHIVFSTPNMTGTSAFYRRCLGLCVVRSDVHDELSLGIDQRTPVLILRREPSPGLSEVGLVARGRQEWLEVRNRLLARDIYFQEDNDNREGGPTIRFNDPDGHNLRLFLPQDESSPVLTPLPRPGLGRLQHITYSSQDPPALAKFYEDVLDFRVSDLVEDNYFVWLRTGVEHHTIAVSRGHSVGLDHFAFELPDWDSFKVWCDFLTTEEVKIVWGPGRHGPGNNLFFFVLDPDGNRVEFSCELEKFYDQSVKYTPRVWKRGPAANLWGPGPPWPR